MPPPKSYQPKDWAAASSEGPHVRECRGGCKGFGKSGSSAYIDMRTCKKCGKITKTKKEKQVIDQAACPHASIERSGSSRKTCRAKCKLCGMLLDEQPQSE